MFAFALFLDARSKVPSNKLYAGYSAYNEHLISAIGCKDTNKSSA